MQPSYFVSYSHDDRESFGKILAEIQKGPQRFQVWFDERILEPGADIAREIEKTIGRCNVMLFLASRNSVTSRYCRNEIALAYNKGKKIIPLRLHSGVELPLQIQDAHYIDFSANFESGLKELCAFLARDLREGSSPSDTTGPLELKTVSDHIEGRSEQHQYDETIIGARDWLGECRDLVNLAVGKQESGDLVGTTLYCKEALKGVRQTGDKTWEAQIWNILSQVLASLGQISTAIQASEYALRLARKNNRREFEVVALVNLARRHAARDDGNQAEATCVGACRIAQAIGYQLGESIARQNLGVFRLSRGSYESAIEDLNKAKELADVTRSAQLRQATRIELATALLLGHKLSEAEAIVDEAVQYDTPLSSPEAHALRGVIRQRKEKMREATGSFYDALDKAQVVLRRTPQYYQALEVMGLSYCGLMLAKELNDYLDEAVEAYEAACLITNAPGIVSRRLLLFDALAQADSRGKLALVRKTIALAQAG